MAGQAADSRTRRRASRMEGDGCAGRQARFHKIRAWPSLALLVQQAALGAKPAETLARSTGTLVLVAPLVAPIRVAALLAQQAALAAVAPLVLVAPLVAPLALAAADAAAAMLLLLLLPLVPVPPTSAVGHDGKHYLFEDALETCYRHGGGERDHCGLRP